MNSCLYECTVMHRRILPKEHAFVYRVFLFLLDLDELDAVSNRVPIFSSNAPNVYSLRDGDYFQLSSGGLRRNIELFLECEGIFEKPGRIRLLTLPALFGYTFNPISIFFCDRPDGSPMTSVIQVGNTFSELKPFLVPPAGDGFARRVAKDFYVSPFSDLDLAFDFRFDPPGDHLGVWIDNHAGNEKTLISSLTGERRELTTASLLAMTLRYPLITLKVIALIHWEALRLWWKGLPFRYKEADPHKQRGIFRHRPDAPRS